MYRLLNALCQICAFALDLQGYSIEFMFGSSWAVSNTSPDFASFPVNILKFVAAGPVFVLPIIKFWLKDTNMETSMEVVEGTPVQDTNSDGFKESEKKA